MNNLKNAVGLLNAQAPEGEFLAYINPKEAQMLKDAGGSGLLTPQGIPSYFTAAQRESRMGGGSISPGTDTRGGNRNNNTGGGGGGDNNREQYGAVTQYTTTKQAMGTVDAEDEYLAPDPDHYKATQKAIGKTNKELRELGLDKSDWSDWTTEEQETYQKEMNKLNNTEDVNYSFYKGNKGTTNLTFNEHYKDVEATNPTLSKIPTMRFLIAAGRTIKENATTDYGTGKYGAAGTDGSSMYAQDQGGWLGRVFNSDGTVNENLTENEANEIYNQVQVDLPFIIGDTEKPDSVVNKYFANPQNLGISSDYMTTYNKAKADLAKTMNMTPNIDQYGYSGTMTASNIYYNYLKEQGLL